jgi:hypothetical protein
MANVTISGMLVCSDGTNIPLQNTSQAEGTEFNLQTNSTYTTVQQTAGDYAPGKTISHATIQAANGISYAYILRQGLIGVILPIAVKGAAQDGPVPLVKPWTLQPGDQVRVMANTAADRECAVSVYTSTGTCRIFTVTPTGGATNEPVDLQTGESLGSTLQNQTIVRAFCSSVDGNKIDGGGVLAIDEKGVPVGCIPANSPIVQSLTWGAVNIPVALNYKFSEVTTS